jgi:putative ABC transport system permease protein
MLKNYFKIAVRNLLKNKSAAFINIFGLSIGLCSCLLIGIYIRHELNYDQAEPNGDRIVRVIMGYSFDGAKEEKKGNFTSVRVAPVFQLHFPEIVSAVRMVQRSDIVRSGEKQFNEKRLVYAEPSFFKLFSFRLLQGDPARALGAPNKIILTETTARRYFGSVNPIGKTLKMGADGQLYEVTGTMRDSPADSQIKFDFLVSFSSLDIAGKEKTYWDANYTTYFLLKDEKSIGSLQSKIAPFMKKEMEGQGASVNFYLEPFKTIHLHSAYDGFEPTNNIRYIYILEAVALLILLIACFTYINLNTARSLERAKEVGIRKVIGAEKRQLFWQFIGESGLLCAVSIVISLLAAFALLPFFNQLTGKDLPVVSLVALPIIFAMIGVIIVVTLLAGSYPALILSNFQPVKVLKGSFKNTGSGQWLRKSLIVFQFGIAVMLIVSTVIMQNQLHYIQDKDLGYNRDKVLVLPMDRKMETNVQVIKQELLANPNIVSAAGCRNTPVSIGGGYNMRSSVMPENEQIAVTADPIDEDFIRTTGLHLIAGTDLGKQDIRDVSNSDRDKNVFHFILNESAARQLGWTPQQAIGQKMFLDASRPGLVKGVIKDFNFESLHHAIRPLVLFPEPGGSKLLLKLKGGSLSETLAFIGTRWKTLVPYRPFEYRFMDEDFNKLYDAEQRLGKVLNIFSSIAIVLACLGLLGLSSYAARQRIKEIGIRKVLGATVGGVASLLTIDFVKLVLVAVVVASPLAWIAMNQWLDDFAYRISIHWWMVALSALLVILIAVCTVSIQAIRAAMFSPVKSLRSE